MPALQDLAPGDTLIVGRHNPGFDPLRIETVERLTATQAITTVGSRWRLSDGVRLKDPLMTRTLDECAITQKSLKPIEVQEHYAKMEAKSAAAVAEKERSAACYQLSLRIDRLQGGALWRRLSTEDATKLVALIDEITQIQ